MGKDFFMPVSKETNLRNVGKDKPIPLIIPKDDIEKELRKQFEEFVKDDSYFAEYDKYDLLGSKILVRLFVYNPPPKSGLMNIDGSAIEEGIERRKVLPYGKVIGLGRGVTEEYREMFKVGDIAVVGEDIGGSFVNPAYIDWMESRDERPKIKTPQPPVFLGKITTWSDYVFVADRLKEKITREDAFTFFAPQSKFCAKWKR